MASRPGFTTIEVSREVRDKLAKIGAMDDTYTTVIDRLIACWEKTKQKKY